jgi:hypothetical protein
MESSTPVTQVQNVSSTAIQASDQQRATPLSIEADRAVHSRFDALIAHCVKQFVCHDFVPAMTTRAEVPGVACARTG